MPTDKQIEANRRNAQHSTGPRTPEGKARSSTNGLQHGLCAQQLVIPSESQPDFDAHTAALRDDLHPAGATEELLVDQIAAATWRLRRVRNFETCFYSDSLQRLRRHFQNSTDADIVTHIFCGVTVETEKGVTALARHETRHERAFYRALKELKLLQSQRVNEDLQSEPNSTPIPAESIPSEPPYVSVRAAPVPLASVAACQTAPSPLSSSPTVPTETADREKDQTPIFLTAEVRKIP